MICLSKSDDLRCKRCSRNFKPMDIVFSERAKSGETVNLHHKCYIRSRQFHLTLRECKKAN